ncbi:hypothetical protein L210DRAFT_3508174 [Boletus edulis BED1]|uniref:Uncharacterized protein n=1 Tax=Boletus edulis BED1 TaxID=1328754 RepID=A0AAD4G9N7_BOLED|nr:hypothetical protein L210DRAFT_3508174 [Boletus edulis BED1]
MGRPKLYKTSEEKKEAIRANRRAYYARNKNLISAKMKVKYQERASKQGTGSMLGAMDVGATPFKSPKAPRKHNLTTRLQEYLGMSGCDAVERLYQQFLETRCLGSICTTISSLEDIVQNYRATEQDILQKDGVGPHFQEATEASHEAASILSAIEDLFCCAILDITELEEITLVHILSTPARISPIQQARAWNLYEKHYLLEVFGLENEIFISLTEASTELIAVLITKWRRTNGLPPNKKSSWKYAWFEKFPERAILFGNTMGSPLSPPQEQQLANAVKKRKEQLKNWFKNLFGSTLEGWSTE